MKQYNMFYDSINEATKILMEDFGIKFKYGEKGIETAAYDFDNNVIYLPKINPYMLSGKQRDEYRALIYHETRHYLFTDGKVVKKAYEDSEFIKELCNVIEDTRIESIPYKIWLGGKHFLTELRIRWAVKYEQEYKEKKFDIKNPIGYLMTAMVYRNYHQYDIPKDLIPYWEASEAILNDGRLQRSLNDNKASSLVVYDLAKEIEKEWNELIKDDPKMQGPAKDDRPGKGEKGEKGEGNGDNNQDQNKKQKPVKVKVKDIKVDNGQQGNASSSGGLKDGDEVTLVVSDKY